MAATVECWLLTTNKQRAMHCTHGLGVDSKLLLVHEMTDCVSLADVTFGHWIENCGMPLRCSSRCRFISTNLKVFATFRSGLRSTLVRTASSSSSSDRVDSRGPLRQPRVATTTSLGPFSTNAEGCTVTDLLDP